MEIEKLSDDLIQHGFEHQMQDLYLLPQGEKYRCFFRRGPFYERENSNLSYVKNELCVDTALQLINRFKYLGQMDVSEKEKRNWVQSPIPCLMVNKDCDFPLWETICSEKV